MSETKFTLGPWEVKQPGKHNKTQIAITEASQDTLHGPVACGIAIICISRSASQYNLNVPSEKEQANARLISVAPELYEACSEMFTAMTAGPGTGMTQAKKSAAIAKGRAALKKASGE